MKRNKILALLLVTVMLLGMLAGCGETGTEGTKPADNQPQGTVGTQTGEPQRGGHLNIRIGACSGIDPICRGNVNNYMWSTCVFENPLTADANGNLQAGCCDFSMSEDELVIKIWPREGLTFHNGNPVTAEDVYASFDRAMHAGKAFQRTHAPIVTGYYVEDNALVVEFSEHTEEAWSYMGSEKTLWAVMPKEICEKHMDSEILDFTECIGTGPYKITAYEPNVKIDLVRYEEYVSRENDLTASAGPRRAYMDSITVNINEDTSSATMALLNGDYDVDVSLHEDYLKMAEQAGIYEFKGGWDLNGYIIWFNFSQNGDNLCSQYPDLRKAIIAACDTYEVGKMIAGGDFDYGTAPVANQDYQIPVYTQADYWGAPNQQAVEKYLAAATAQGYNDEPIQLYTTSGSTNEAFVLMQSYLKKAGINFKITPMENAALQEFYADTSNNWDVRFSSTVIGTTPGSMYRDLLYLDGPTADPANNKALALQQELSRLTIGSAEYHAKWREMADAMAESCNVVFLGLAYSSTYHSRELHNDYAGSRVYYYNAYWENPEAHQKK